MEKLGITQKGIQAALEIKESYRRHEPVCVPEEDNRILLPEYLMNHDLDLTALEDPLPLAMMATRDPESPMALAAAVRLSPLGRNGGLIRGVFRIVGDASEHPLVKKCVDLVSERDFEPDAIADVRRATGKIIVQKRKQYTAAMKDNLQSLLEGSVSPREFVERFFKLTEAGNLRHAIRQRLVMNLLLSETIRPSVKFLILENFDRFAPQVRQAIVQGVCHAPASRHVDMIREELAWMTQQQRLDTTLN